MDEIKKSFDGRRKMVDPDITGDNSTTQIFQELNLAYETLINEESRKDYDEYLASVGFNLDH